VFFKWFILQFYKCAVKDGFRKSGHIYSFHHKLKSIQLGGLQKLTSKIPVHVATEYTIQIKVIIYKVFSLPFELDTTEVSKPFDFHQVTIGTIYSQQFVHKFNKEV